MPELKNKSDGYFLVWRCLFKDTLWLKGTPTQKLLMIVCIGKANHEDNEWSWQGEKFTVKRGQFITSLDKLREAIGKHISIQNIRSALTNLQKYKFLSMISTKTGRLITVLNYDTWQSVTNIVTNKEVTNTQQRGNKEVTTNNHNKNNKNDNKEKKSKSTKLLFEDNIRLTEKEYNQIVEQENESIANKCIEFLSNYKHYKGVEYQSDYHAIKQWVIARVKKEMKDNVEPEPEKKLKVYRAEEDIL